MLNTILIRTHRWLTLVLLPLFAIIIVTGAILSVEPIARAADETGIAAIHEAMRVQRAAVASGH